MAARGLTGSVHVLGRGSLRESDAGKRELRWTRRIEVPWIQHLLGNQVAFIARNRARAFGPEHVRLVRSDPGRRCRRVAG